MKISLFFSGIFALLLFVSANAKGTNHTNDVKIKKYDVRGGVFQADTKKPLCHVNVTVYGTSKKEKTVVTNGDGYYSFNDLKPGTYKLVFEKEGFRKIIKDKVVIRREEEFQLNIEMFEMDEFQIIPGQVIFSDYR